VINDNAKGKIKSKDIEALTTNRLMKHKDDLVKQSKEKIVNLERKIAQLKSECVRAEDDMTSLTEAYE